MQYKGMQCKFKMSDWRAFGLFGKYRMRRFQWYWYLQKGKRTSGRHSNPVPWHQMRQNGHNVVRKACGNLGGKWGMGQASKWWNVRCAQRMTRREGAGKGRGSKGCRGAKHGQACTKDRTGAVALRAALELAVQLGRGDVVNRQAEMANPTKCRDSLQSLKQRCNALPHM
jgi:hypothetical protein